MANIGQVVEATDARDVPQGLAVANGDLVAFFDFAIDHFQLQQTVGCAEFVHLAIGAWCYNSGFACEAEVLEKVNALLHVLVVCDERASLEGVEDLGRVKGEHGEVAPVENGDTVLLYAEHMRGIVEELESVGVGNLLEFLDLAGISIDMDGHDGCRARRDKRFHLCWI